MKRAAIPFVLALATAVPAVTQSSVTVQSRWISENGNRQCGLEQIVVSGEPAKGTCMPDPVTKGCVMLAGAPGTRAQTMPNEMPEEPADILKLASAVNGLQAAGLSPWHIKASYQTFDDSGQPKSSGTFEEFWDSPTKFKRILTTAASSEAEFGTDHGFYRFGGQDWPNQSEILLGETLFQPVPEDVNLLGLHQEKKELSLGPVHLECVTLESAGAFVSPSAYCFAQDKPMLRLTVASQGRVHTEYDNIVVLQGRYLARDIRVVGAKGETSATVHIDALEQMSSIPDSDLSPPTGAIPISEPISLAQATAASLALLQSLPSYPQFAKTTGVQGDVLLDVSVDRNGQVENAQVISGPAYLRSASLRAVKNWKYETSLIFGQPLAFHTQVKIIFSLGSP